MNNTTETHYSVSGMKCGGCVAKATEAVSKLPGFVAAQFDLAGKSAVIKGSADPQAVIQALNGVGYPTELKTD
ncbi:MAG: heavy-metal-associated domain-containing protein [Sulfuricaulis sp.]|nr:heavy-metal-associated domain-containing protein [Sulfuricaulis sp.]